MNGQVAHRFKGRRLSRSQNGREPIPSGTKQPGIRIDHRCVLYTTFVDSLTRFRIWFWLAAGYNVLFGLVATLFPDSLLLLLTDQPISARPLLQCIGMIVGLYGIGYALVAKDPNRYGAFAVIGLIGKILGPIGFAWSVYSGALPMKFGLLNLTNDVIWIPAFSAFCWAWWKLERKENRDRTR